MSRFVRSLSVTALLFAAATAAATSAPSMREVLAASYAVRDLGSVDLSPNGSTVTWEETFHDTHQRMRARRESALYVQSLASGTRVRLTAGTGNPGFDEENPVWSPDGRHLAFLSDARSPGQLQIYVADARAAHVRRIGSLSGNVQRLTWAPDGKQLAFLYISDARRQAGALAPGARDVGVIGTSVEEQRLTLLDAGSGAMRAITPADTYVYEYGWSPDGAQIALTYAKGNGDNNWWIARLARVDVATGAMHDLLAPSYQIDDPRWSPDGKQIAIVGGIMSDFGSTGGDVYLVDARSGATRNLTAGAPISAQSLRWNDAGSLDAVAHVSGSMRLLRIDAASGTSRRAYGSRRVALELVERAKRRHRGGGTRVVRRSAGALGRRPFGFAPDFAQQRRCGAPLRQRRLVAVVERRVYEPRLAGVSARFRPDPHLPNDHDDPWRPVGGVGSVVRQPERQRTRVARLLRLHAQSARQLRSRRGIHRSKR